MNDSIARNTARDVRHDDDFASVVRLIEQARTRMYQAVNTEMIDLYWMIGEYVSKKVAAAEWGKEAI
jgi:hypothetical protein